jgi:hypothetical protein
MVGFDQQSIDGSIDRTNKRNERGKVAFWKLQTDSARVPGGVVFRISPRSAVPLHGHLVTMQKNERKKNQPMNGPPMTLQ